MTNEERIQKEAEDIVNIHYQNKLEAEAEAYADSVDRRGCSFWRGLKMGHMAGVVAENKCMTEQLKQERNKAIDDAINRIEKLESTSEPIFGIAFRATILELESLKH